MSSCLESCLELLDLCTLQMSSAASSRGEGERVRSEDELGVKWDRCVADAIIKTGEGVKEGVCVYRNHTHFNYFHLSSSLSHEKV